MNQEQKTIAKRLGIIGVVLLVVILAVYFIYAPDQTPATKLYPAGQKQAIAAVFRAGTWSIDSNGTGRWEAVAGGDSNLGLGQAGDVPVTGTWDIAEGPSIGVFRNGLFILLINRKPQQFAFGSPGDTPIIGDWNGDGRSKIGVFRNGFWLLDLNGNGKWDGAPKDRMIALGGTPGEKPVVGDWNGDGITDVGVYRPDTSFAIDANGNQGWDPGDKIMYLGNPGDVPYVGDWNGDGRTKLGVNHKGFWMLDYNGNYIWDGGTTDRFIALGGVAVDVPIVGDWNGDGRTKVGVYRDGTWILDFDGNSVYDKFDKDWLFGLKGDVPVVIQPRRAKK